MRSRLLGATALLAICIFASSQASAQDASLTRNTYGSVGLVDMPSAFMAPDGELSFSADYFENNQRYSLGFQALPWLETSFRYSGLQHFSPLYPVYFDRSFAVKARLWQEGDWFPAIAVGINDLIGTGVFGGEYIVASKHIGNIEATLGLGWGRLGTVNTFENPFGLISDSFKTRGTSTSLGGSFNFNQYFHGPDTGVFGGISWHTPVEGLTLTAEMSSDAYVAEKTNGNFRPHSELNLSASYHWGTATTLGLQWLYGRAIGGSISFALDPTANAYPQKVNNPPLPVPAERTTQQRQLAVQLMGGKIRSPAGAAQVVDALWGKFNIRDSEVRGRTLILTVSGPVPRGPCAEIRNALATQDGGFDTVELSMAVNQPPTRCSISPPRGIVFATDAFINPMPASRPAVLMIDASGPPLTRPSPQFERKIIADAKAQNLNIRAIKIGGGEALVYYDNTHYASEVDALTHLTALLMSDAPPEVERFRMIRVAEDVPQREFEVLRAPQERQYDNSGDISVFLPETGTSTFVAPMDNPVLAAATRDGFPKFSWSILPQVHQEFFDPENPIGVQLVAAFYGSLALAPGLSLSTSLEANIFSTFNTKRLSDSLLPHVRTDQTRYFSKGKNGIDSLEMRYQFRLAPEVSALAQAGYLESMFGGAGGEVLWRPEGQRWAFGIDGYEVWQRKFDRLFGFQPYHVFTGHLSVYYASPWYRLNFALHAGQYLAGDRGVTLEVSRRFSNGIEVGAFATKTNVSAAQFGEGSFDKGIRIRIPIGSLLPQESQNGVNLELRPVQRDGGQALYSAYSLYNLTRDASEVEIDNRLH